LLSNHKCETIEVISGPIYNSEKKLEGYENVFVNEQKVLMKDGIIVPSHLYKLIKCNTQSKAYASGFVFENAKTFDNGKTLGSFEQSIEDIENLTGLTFNFKDSLNGKLS
jgi:DNA/RNA endonuclease G (NUC1)